jgi:hypothetical protein
MSFQRYNETLDWKKRTERVIFAAELINFWFTNNKPNYCNHIIFHLLFALNDYICLIV